MEERSISGDRPEYPTKTAAILRESAACAYLDATVALWLGNVVDTEAQIKQNYGSYDHLLLTKLAEIEAMPPVFKWKVSRNANSYNCLRQTRPLRQGEPEHSGIFEFAGVFDTREAASEAADRLNRGEVTPEGIHGELKAKRAREAEAEKAAAIENVQAKREERASGPLPSDITLPEAIEKVWTRLMCDGDFRKLAENAETWREMLETGGLLDRVGQAASEAGVAQRFFAPNALSQAPLAGRAAMWAARKSRFLGEWFKRDGGEILGEVKRRVDKTLREKRKAPSEGNSGLPKLVVNADELLKGIAETAGWRGHTEVGSVISGYEIVAAGKRACAEPDVCWRYDERGGVWGGSYFDTLKRALKEFVSLEIAGARSL